MTLFLYSGYNPGGDRVESPGRFMLQSNMVFVAAVNRGVKSHFAPHHEWVLPAAAGLR
jgi:hypothetical protein